VTDNRWQVGVWGNYTDADDEEVRQAIDATKQQLGCSSSEAAKWLIRAAYARNNGASAIQESTAYAPSVQVDNSEMVSVLKDIYSAIVAMSQRVDNLGAAQAPTAAPELPATMTDKHVEWEEIDPNADTPFLQGVRKMGARPAMRLQD